VWRHKDSQINQTFFATIVAPIDEALLIEYLPSGERTNKITENRRNEIVAARDFFCCSVYNSSFGFAFSFLLPLFLSLVSSLALIYFGLHPTCWVLPQTSSLVFLLVISPVLTFTFSSDSSAALTFSSFRLASSAVLNLACSSTLRFASSSSTLDFAFVCGNFAVTPQCP
jgi:hypothetical protein